MSWWAGKNEEWYTVGPASSREEAIAGGREEFEEGFFICEADLLPVRFNAERMIEDQYFEADDLFSPEDGPEPDRLKGSEEADKELQELLDNWAERWQTTFVPPTMFVNIRNQEQIT